MTVEIPGYKIIRVLGKGGMATVYLAEQEIFEREVALKVMSKSLADDPKFGQRFFREAKIVSHLVHPNIVTVYDVGVHEGTYYLSMEYIDGNELKQVRKGMSLEKRVQAVIDIAKALEYAGRKGYVHRDIKPENIMFHSVDGRAVLTDFGIARAAETESTVTQTGMAIGTPHYMSPEQAKGENVDHRSDIYSLGVVFFLLLSGHVPYDAESAVAIGIKHITEPVPLLPYGMDDLQPVIDTMMAKKKENRYQSGRELIAHLEQLDITGLEHTVNMSAVNAAEERDGGSVLDGGTEILSTDQVTYASLDPVQEIERDEYAFVYDEDQTEYRDPSYLGSWLTGVGLIVLVIGGGIYYQKPPLFAPYIDEVDRRITSIYTRLKSKLENSQTLSSIGDQPGVGQTSVDDSKKLPHYVEAGKALLNNQEATGSRLEVEDKPSANKHHDKKSAKDARTSAGKDSVEASDKPTLVSPGIAVDKPFRKARPEETASLKSKVVREGRTLKNENAVILGLRKKIETLKVALQKDNAFLPDLVNAYRDLLANVPKDEASRDQLNQLRDREIEKVKELAQLGKSKSASKRLMQLKYLFPELPATELQVLESNVSEKEKVSTLLDAADVLYQQNALTRPESENALAKYKAVLALSPDNSEAKAGIKRIALKFAELGESAFNSGDWNKANIYLQKALSINAKDKTVRVLEKRISSVKKRHKKHNKLIELAEKQLQAGKLFSPKGKSAYDHYIKALNENSKSVEAKDGINQVIDALSANVWRFVGDEQFDKARAVLKRPLKLLPVNTRLQSLSQAVADVIIEKELSSMPRVAKLLVSGEKLRSLNGFQGKVTQPDRSIFIKFSFENFKRDTTVINAVLKDGAGAIKIAETPVVISGRSGSKDFRIDRPVEGFPAGSYTLEMRLGSRAIKSVLFQVE